MFKILKASIQKFLSQFGLTLIRINTNVCNPDSNGTTQAAVISLKKRSYKINSVLDIGASDGRWSKAMMVQYPDAQYMLIEAQEFHKPQLDLFVAHNKNAKYVLAAAGAKEGEIFFDAGNPFGGQASSTPFPSHNIVVPVTTIDLEVEKNGLTGPFLIKFDTHGYEIPILQGASRTLQNTAVIIMECYIHRLTKESLLFNEMCGYLDGLGFRCIDLVDPVWRIYDNTFWQMDLVFIKKESAEFQYSNYE